LIIDHTKGIYNYHFALNFHRKSSKIPILPNDVLKCILEYFSAKELTEFRLVCHQWRNVISQVPVYINIGKLKPEYRGNLCSLFSIDRICLPPAWEMVEETRVLKIVQNCKKLTQLHDSCYGDVSNILSHIPNPQLMEIIDAESINDFPLDKLVNLKYLK
jgi:hypothetical protein